MLTWTFSWLLGLIQAGRTTVRRAIVLPFLASVAKIEADTDAEIAAVLAELDAKNPKAADALRAAIAEIESDQLISLPKSEAAPKPVKPVGRPRKCIASENHTGQNTSKP